MKPTTIHVRCPNPKCGQDGWLHSVVPKAYYSNFRNYSEWEAGERIYSKDSPRTKRRHPYKWMSFMNLFCGRQIRTQPPPHPTINPSPLTRTTKSGKDKGEAYEAHTALVDEIHGLEFILGAYAEVLPLALEKYPSLTAEVSRFVHYSKVVRIGLHSAIDNRHARSLFEWIPICETALEEGIGVAARKYSGFTVDGKEVRLSDHRIKDKIPIAADFAMKYPSHLIGFTRSLMIISEFISNDVELLNKFEKSYREKEERYRNTRELEQEQGQRQGVLRATPTDSTNIKYKYRYFYVRHYNEALYQKQKQNGMRHPNGRRECGPFKKSAFPDDVIEQFERTRRT